MSELFKNSTVFVQFGSRNACVEERAGVVNFCFKSGYPKRWGKRSGIQKNFT